MLRISCFLVVVSLSLGFLPGRLEAVATQGAEDFDEGIREFRAGKYPAALESFLDAQRAGLDTPGLHYNLGATYYRLARYAEAEREFRALERDPRWAPLAHYNLGLTAQRLGRAHEAAEHFELTHRTTSDLNLRTLSATALERLGRAPLRNTFVASLAGGYDSNVTLSPDAVTVGVSHQSDVFVEALAAASRSLTGNAARGSYGHGGLILRKYRDLDQFDLIGVRLGLSHEADSGRSRGGVGGYIDATYVGGKPFERAALLDIQVRTRLDGGGDLRGRYRFGRIEGGSGLEYLDGWQQHLSADTGLALTSAFVRIGYQLELNRRRDLQQGGEFISYSPTRHSLFTSLALLDVRGWRTEARGEYRLSRYHDPYRLNGGTLEVARKDDRYGLALRANRHLTAPWNMLIDYSYYRNESNLDTYDYGRYQALVGIEAVLEK